jgi:hypothetical protein
MDESKSTIELFPLYLTILLLSIVIIYHTAGHEDFLPIQYTYGSTENRTVSAGQQIIINASRTNSSTVGPIDLTWTQIKGPSVFGDNKTIKGPVLSVTAPVSNKSQILEFQLVASKGQVSKSANVNVLVKGDQPPRAETGNYNIINAKDICGENTNSLSSSSPQLILDASKSTDPDGGPLRYKWTQIKGTPVTISDPNNSTASVKNDSICRLRQSTYLEFNVDVTDKFWTTSDSVTIPVHVNQMPIAKINTPDNLQFGQNLTLDASSSSDTDGSITEYIWSYKVNGGNGSEENTTTRSPTLKLCFICFTG